MALSESGGAKLLLCVGLFVVVSSFCSCNPLMGLEALDKFRRNSELGERGVHHGRLFIGQYSLQRAKLGTSEEPYLDTAYQADMGWAQPSHVKGHVEDLSRPKHHDAAVERLLKMEPKVECTGDSMRLQVQDAASISGSLFFVDRGSHLSPLPLSNLPQSCGYSLRSTRQNVVLVAPYDGCFVALEEESYVLPLRWLGLPVKMSCPLMRPSSSNPPMVTCHSGGMVVKTDWPVAKIKVNLNGNWESLMKASPKCDFSVVVHPEGVVISVHYAPCLEKKDGMYHLELAGEGETKISCPSLSGTENTKFPPKDPVKQTQTASQWVLNPTPSHNTGSAQMYPFAVPLAPGNPQNPSPQIPYHIYPHYFNPNSDTKFKPTVHPPPSPLAKTPGLPQKPEGPVLGKVEHQQQRPLPAPPVPQEPNGHIYPQYPFHPQVWPHVHYQTHRPPTQSQMLKPEESNAKVPGTVAPGKPASQRKEPDASKGQAPQHPYPHPSLPHYHPVGKPQPLQPAGHHMLNPYYFYHQLGPVNPPKENQEHKPSYPQPSRIPGAGTPAKTPIKPPAVKPPGGQTYNPFNMHYPQQPQLLQPITLPPATNPLPPPQVTITPSSNGGIGPQPSSQHMPPFYCPQFCPSAISNCCPQISFHQHLHHVIPAGLVKEAPPLHPALSYFHPAAYSGFGYGSAASGPQKPYEATQTQASIFLPPQNIKQPYLLPPDGNHAALTNIHVEPANSELTYPHFMHNTYYQYHPQNGPQSQLAVNHNAPSKPQVSVKGPGTPVMQYRPYYIELPQQQMSQQFPGNMRSFIGQYQQEESAANLQNEPAAKEQQPSAEKAIEPQGQTHPEVRSIADSFLVPYTMLQDAQAPINSSEPSVSDSKKQEKTVQANAKSYVLLQHGPPGMDPSSFRKDLLPDRERVYETAFLAQSPKPKPLDLPQEKPQPARLLPATDNHMPKPGDELDSFPLFVPATDHSHYVPLPQEPFVSAALLSPLQPVASQDSNRRIPDPRPGKSHQQWGSASDYQMD